MEFSTTYKAQQRSRLSTRTRRRTRSTGCRREELWHSAGRDIPSDEMEPSGTEPEGEPQHRGHRGGTTTGLRVGGQH